MKAPSSHVISLFAFVAVVAAQSSDELVLQEELGRGALGVVHKAAFKGRFVLPGAAVLLYYAFLGRLPFADEEDLPTDIYNDNLCGHSPHDCTEICEIDPSLTELVEPLLCHCREKRHRCKDFFGFAFSMVCDGACRLAGKLCKST